MRLGVVKSLTLLRADCRLLARIDWHPPFRGHVLENPDLFIEERFASAPALLARYDRLAEGDQP